MSKAQDFVEGRANTLEDKEAMLRKILYAWQRRPALRFGQLISNAAFEIVDFYYIEDEELLKRIEDYTK